MRGTLDIAFWQEGSRRGVRLDVKDEQYHLLCSIEVDPDAFAHACFWHRASRPCEITRLTGAEPDAAPHEPRPLPLPEGIPYQPPRLFHCGTWQEVTTLPWTCPRCGTVLFGEFAA